MTSHQICISQDFLSFICLLNVECLMWQEALCLGQALHGSRLLWPQMMSMLSSGRSNICICTCIAIVFHLCLYFHFCFALHWSRLLWPQMMSMLSSGWANIYICCFSAELNGKRWFAWKWKFYHFLVLLVSYIFLQCLKRSCWRKY